MQFNDEDASHLAPRALPYFPYERSSTCPVYGVKAIDPGDEIRRYGGIYSETLKEFNDDIKIYNFCHVLVHSAKSLALISHGASDSRENDLQSVGGARARGKEEVYRE